MKRTKSRTKEEINSTADRAESYYFSHIKDQLTESDKGRYIAIDANTGEWEIDDTRQASERLRERVPDANIHLIRHIIMVSEYFGAVPDELAAELCNPVSSHLLADKPEEFGR